MEDTLRGYDSYTLCWLSSVLILVLMEDTLRATLCVGLAVIVSLNPCFNGRYSQRTNYNILLHYSNCLNPCFNGRYSQREQSYLCFSI